MACHVFGLFWFFRINFSKYFSSLYLIKYAEAVWTFQPDQNEGKKISSNGMSKLIQNTRLTIFGTRNSSTHLPMEFPNQTSTKIGMAKVQSSLPQAEVT